MKIGKMGKKCIFFVISRVNEAEEKRVEMKNVRLNDVISKTCKCLKTFVVNKTNGANMNG